MHGGFNGSFVQSGREILVVITVRGSVVSGCSLENPILQAFVLPHSISPFNLSAALQLQHW